ncbi:MAG: hypothetical protein V1694_07180 [Candidatus Eisenbacteria bacterium]
MKFFGRNGRLLDDLRRQVVNLRDLMHHITKDRLRFARGALIISLVLLFCAFSCGLLFGGRSELPKLQEDGSQVLSAKPLGKAPKQLSYYSGIIAGKELFGSGVMDTTSAGVPVFGGADSGRRVEHLSVLGIFIDKMPEAVVEDTRENKTYSLYEGDTFRGMLVEKILKGKIIFRYENQTIELLL